MLVSHAFALPKPMRNPGKRAYLMGTYITILTLASEIHTRKALCVMKVYPINDYFVERSSWVKATPHTRLKAHDHCNLRALVGRKGGNCSSSLHTQR